ncbi:hypothetical protein AF72_11125 [Xylella taiwanensis]|uniref:Uncharacterized protein n=1 Tax=Xylella taiwanensis TaxID=1444770 RepID=Z9JHV8_9GAMM|nr:hypothetical protein AF72_11125 [Xylella taiwanensis]
MGEASGIRERLKVVSRFDAMSGRIAMFLSDRVLVHHIFCRLFDSMLGFMYLKSIV